MRRFLGVVVVLALLVTGYSLRADIARFVAGFAGSDPALAGTSTATASPGDGASGAVDCSLADVQPLVMLNIGVVIDPTTSTASSFRASVVAALGANLAAHLPAKSTTPSKGVPTVDGARIHIKQVSDNAYQYGQPDLDITIPGVLGLPEQPDVTCVKAGTYQTWIELRKQWSIEYDNASAVLADAVKQVEALRFISQNSGIQSALSALAVSTSTDHAAFMVASDMDSNQPVQQAGNLGGRPLILLAPCPSGSAAKCSSDVQSFANWATDSLHAGPVSVFRPEQMADAMNALFKGAAS